MTWGQFVSVGRGLGVLSLVPACTAEPKQGPLSQGPWQHYCTLETLHDKELQDQHDGDITESSPMCSGSIWNPSMTASRLALLQGHIFFFTIKNFRRNDPGVTHKLNDQEKDETSGPLASVTHALPRSARAL